MLTVLLFKALNQEEQYMLSPYRAVNTPRLGYTNQSVNVV